MEKGGSSRRNMNRNANVLNKKEKKKTATFLNHLRILFNVGYVVK